MRIIFSTIAGAVLALTLTFTGARAAEVTVGLVRETLEAFKD